MRTEYGAGVPESATFARRLQELKREGANLLLVGETAPEAHAAASRRLLEGDDGDHRHVFAFAGDAGIGTALPGEPDPSRTRVVRQADGVERDWPAAIPETVVDESDPSALAAAVVAAVDDLGAEALDPGDLRLCLDSVTALVANADSEDVFRTLHLVTARVRQVSGLGHYHLRVDRDDDYVRLLEPVFDGIVELRVVDGAPEQRWHLRDGAVTSDWLPL